MKKFDLADTLQLMAEMGNKVALKMGRPFFEVCYMDTFSDLMKWSGYLQQYTPKNFQIIRDYHNGTIKIIAKAFPPVSKGTKRNRQTFKTYDRRLYNSITRSKQTVYELAICNKWSYFVTFTIDKNKYDRTDIKAFMKAFIKWLNNFSDRKLGDGRRIEYLLIPEIGKRGAWHLHGLIRGLPRKHLSKFVKGKHPQRLIDKGWLNWKAYEEKFGFCCFARIIDSKMAVRYATKKISKSYTTQMRGCGERLYYCSKGLKRSKEIKRGYNIVPVVDYDFENEWVGIKWIYNQYNINNDNDLFR